MTLRPSRHFITRTAMYAFALAFFSAPVLLLRPGYASLSAPFALAKDRSEKPGALESTPERGFSQDQKGQEQKKQDEPLLRIETELVQIDVVVTDKQGKLARDL